WKATLENYAFPIIGDMNVADIDEAHLVKVLQPIWRKIPETARRLRGRIESILGYATASKRRSGLNPARWRDNLQTLLGGMVITVKHHPALPYKEIPAFMSELRSKDSVSARALEFAILTATRTAEVIGARWSEIAFKEKLWIIPKERMKGGREHRVPLSERALQILSGLQGNDDLFVFGTLSNMAMLEMLRGMRSGVVVHGFRSSFDDWVSEKTNYPSIVTDKALAHKVKDKVEAAYRRGDLFEKRQLLMDDWAAYCMSPPVVDDANVTQFRRGRAS
ncbi:MAG: tyrosine-type recombinase/integrase, partial [Beijerinckiaceae bacterium]